MKKLFTFLIAIGAVVSLQAQTTREEARRVVLGGNGQSSRNGDVVYDRNGNASYPDSRRKAEIDRINREYDDRIRSVRNDRSLSSSQKERIIRELESERRMKIREINQRYRDRDRDYRDNDRHEKNKNYKNGKGRKLGWEKGRGNPHRTGQWPGNSGKVKDRHDDDRYDDDDDDDRYDDDDDDDRRKHKGKKNKRYNRRD